MKIIAKIYQKIRVALYEMLSDLSDIESLKFLKLQPVLFTGGGKIFIGEGVVIGVQGSPFYYSGYAHIEARNTNSIIDIAKNVWVNNNLTIICDRTSVLIEENVLIGWSVEILDSDFHEQSPMSRRSGVAEAKSVLIKRNAWIGSNVKIFKGVTIGVNSIVANGSIVVESVPDNVIVGGVPARVLRSLV